MDNVSLQFLVCQISISEFWVRICSPKSHYCDTKTGACAVDNGSQDIIYTKVNTITRPVMGMRGGGAMLHKATVKSLDSVLTILCQRVSGQGSKKPCVDIDANWVVRKFASQTGSPLR